MAVALPLGVADFDAAPRWESEPLSVAVGAIEPVAVAVARRGDPEGEALPVPLAEEEPLPDCDAAPRKLPDGDSLWLFVSLLVPSREGVFPASAPEGVAEYEGARTAGEDVARKVPESIPEGVAEGEGSGEAVPAIDADALGVPPAALPDPLGAQLREALPVGEGEVLSVPPARVVGDGEDGGEALPEVPPLGEGAAPVGVAVDVRGGGALTEALPLPVAVPRGFEGDALGNGLGVPVAEAQVEGEDVPEARGGALAPVLFVGLPLRAGDREGVPLDAPEGDAECATEGDADVVTEALRSGVRVGGTEGRESSDAEGPVEEEGALVSDAAPVAVPASLREDVALTVSQGGAERHPEADTV